MRPVTDPALLAQLNGEDKSGQPVTDPNLLAQLNGEASTAQSGGGWLNTMSNAADRITGTMPYAAGLMAPTLGLGYKAAEKMNQASGQLGEATTEAVAKNFPNAPTAIPVGLGTAASIFSNPMTYVDPGAGFSGKVLKPVAPLERQAAVSAAERIGMPLRRGEVTGGRVANNLSNFMEKTVLGSGPEEAFSKQQYNALDAEKARLQGSPPDIYAVGKKAQNNIVSRSDAMKATKDTMFNAVPDDVHVPISNAKQTAATLLDEQSKLYGGTQSPEVMRWTKIVQDAESSDGTGVTGGPEYKGITQTIPGREIPASTVNRDSSLIGENGKPLSYQETIPGKTVPPKTEYGIQASVGPEQQFQKKPNYFALKRLRENLNGAIKQAAKADNLSDYRDLTRLKTSLDKDINDFASGGVSPLDDMISKDFKENYRKANAFSGAYKGLFKSDEAKALLEAPPEKVVDMVFKGKNNETAIKQFRAMAGEEGFLPVKQKFTQELVDSNNVTKELSKYEEGTLRSIYSAKELQELRDFGLAQGVPKTVSGMQGTQGSARSNIAGGQWAGLGAGIISLLHGNILGGAAGIGQFVAPAGVSRLNLATAGGVPASFGRGSMAATRATVSAGARHNSRDLISELVDRMRKRKGQ